jgi:lipopolysaccharide transport system ATP-binding protein
MSSDVVIQARNLGKAYAVYRRPIHRLAELLDWREGASWSTEFWALKSVDLEVRRGETVGIVGSNGSGKSTLLQIVCGTLNPTQGEISVSGRISALLELGAGFNPEFTGRENARLAGVLIGMNHHEIDARLDEIATFAEIGDYLDQPVKHYSSGMFLRLAFAVAVSNQPDVLVVDEALAVGDEAFQRKCLQRIEQMKARGMTTLFVSHSAAAVLQLCDRAVLLHRGNAVMVGEPKPVIDHYHEMLYSAAPSSESATRNAEHNRSRRSNDDLSVPRDGVMQARPRRARFDPTLVPRSAIEYASQGANISHVRIETCDGDQVNILDPEEEYWFRYRVEFDTAAFDVHFGMLIKTTIGTEVFGMGSHRRGRGVSVVSGEVFEVAFPFRPTLMPGTYFMNAGCMGRTALLDEGERFLHRFIDIATFRIDPEADPERRAGIAELAAGPVKIERSQELA